MSMWDWVQRELQRDRGSYRTAREQAIRRTWQSSFAPGDLSQVSNHASPAGGHVGRPGVQVGVRADASWNVRHVHVSLVGEPPTRTGPGKLPECFAEGVWET